MCYSKEVSLVAASLVTLSCTYSWIKYVGWHIWKSTMKLSPVFKYAILGYFCLAGHQFFEFLAIHTGEQIIYKLGLIISILSMYLFMRSLESLTKLSFGSKVFALLIALVGLEMFTRNMIFEDMHFWVRGESHFLWASVWFALFIYWNVSIFYTRKISTSKIDKKLLLYYGLFLLNISFLLSLAYAYAATFYFKGTCFPGLDCTFDVVTDSTSIWCAFAVIQAFLIPVLFHMMKDDYNLKAKLKVSKVTLKTKLKLIGITALIWLLFYFSFPTVFDAGLKMVTH